MEGSTLGIYALIILLGIIGLIFIVILGKYIKLWFQAYVSGTPISIFNIIGMSLRKIPPPECVHEGQQRMV